jgi:hypothetical protein
MSALARETARMQCLFLPTKDADPDIPILKQAKAEHARAAITRQSPVSSLGVFRWFTQSGHYNPLPKGLV